MNVLFFFSVAVVDPSLQLCSRSLECPKKRMRERERERESKLELTTAAESSHAERRGGIFERARARAIKSVSQSVVPW